MKSFNSTASNQHWRNKIYARKDVKSCSKNHSFCHVEYEWGLDNQMKNQKNFPIVPGYSNFQFAPEPTERIKVRADGITQQSLDDWIAQSINRPLKAILHPQRRFMIPGNLQTYLKQRYNYKKIIKLAKAGDQQSKYFNQQSMRKKKKISRGDRKAIIDEQEVKKYFYDFQNLQPNTDIPGTQIRFRQMKTEVKKQIKRRHAVLLQADVHYERLLKQLSKDKKIDIQQNESQQKLQQFDVNELKRQKLYSYNLASLNRKDCFESVPSSVIEKQIQIVRCSKNSFLDANRQFLNKQEQIAEIYRLQLNEKTKNGIKKIQELFHPQEKKEKVKSLSTQQPAGVKRNMSIHKPNMSTISQKEKSKLEAKVIKLLNNMQVISEKVDVNMVKFNVHCVERKLQNVDSRPQIKWILKAQQKINQKQNILAIDCYKQAIILQPEFFIPVFNIAVLLEKENMFEAAKLWFSLASQFEASDENVQFGLALVLIKQLKYSEGLKRINDLIQQLENSKKKVQIIYYYLRALCQKQLGMLDGAKTDYELVDKESQPANYNVLGHFVFSRLFSKIRRIPLQFDCLSYMKFRQTVFLILFENKKKIKEDKESLVDIAQKLMKTSFFCRFSISLVQKLLKVATYEKKQKNQIIFLKQSQTIIILSGIVSMKSHQKNFLRPETVGVLKEGGLIGTSDISKTASEKPNIWYLADSQVELIKTPRPLFNDFWKGQITFEFDFKFNFLRNIALFKGLPQTTLFKLCQLFEKRTFEQNTILFNDCSYRSQLINKHGHGFGLGKIQATDHRFVSSSANLKNGQQNKDFYKKKNRSKIYTLIKKHIFKFNAMKFSAIKYPGLFVIQKGFVELENDKGFRCNGLISQGQFFGENLMIDSEGLQKYGRLKVESQSASLWLISREKLIWAFTEQDKQIMAKNIKNRQIVQTIRYLSNRYSQCQQVKARIKDTFKN